MSLSRIPPQAFSCGSGTRVLKRGRTLSFILAALLLFSACAEAVASDATVTAGALVPVFAAAGGAGAMYGMMRAVRHKTLHRKFMIGLPALLALHILAIVALHILLL